MWSWQPPSVLLINFEQWQIPINATLLWLVVPSYCAWLLYYVWAFLRRYLRAKQRPVPAIRIRHYLLVFVNFLTSHGADLWRRRKQHSDGAASDQLPTLHCLESDISTPKRRSGDIGEAPEPSHEGDCP